jgi:hypothetical protein
MITRFPHGEIYLNEVQDSLLPAVGYCLSHTLALAQACWGRVLNSAIRLFAAG